ncbi:GNAT family N-acetyltransferase [Streptomyces sp. NPDC048277]|uniref:GNAT family N-acetyltransferase n=1 Tax=Streptomyces sp. NPDC048277 TaxID=3155027 RepID=UPI00340685F7
MESRAYTELGLSEGPVALRSRADTSPETCFVLDVDARPAGYVLALPYPAFRYPDLERAEEPGGPARRPGNLHLHDIVVAERLRGRGLGRRLLNHLTLTAGAHGFERISLIAVGRSEPFWTTHGFTAYPGISPGGYGANAVYMSRPQVRGPQAGGPQARGPHVHGLHARGDGRVDETS